ncbi:MAG: hypothetical protein ABSC64_03335 [Candidatus Korobacteraceae bacterium]
MVRWVFEESDDDFWRKKIHSEHNFNRYIESIAKQYYPQHYPTKPPATASKAALATPPEEESEPEMKSSSDLMALLED